MVSKLPRSLGAYRDLKLGIMVPMSLDALDYCAMAKYIPSSNDLLASCFRGSDVQ